MSKVVQGRTNNPETATRPAQNHNQSKCCRRRRSKWIFKGNILYNSMVNQIWKNKCLTLIAFARGPGNDSGAVPEHKTNLYLTQCQTSGGKKKINGEITISQPPPSNVVAGTFTLAINYYLAGVLLKLTNCRTTDWRSESINHKNLPLQRSSHPVCVWCCGTTGSELMLLLSMTPSGFMVQRNKIVNVLEIRTQPRQIHSGT